MDLYLNSFVASGELINVQSEGDFKITGKAIATLEQYQIETRREKDAIAMQRRIVLLTFVLAVFAAFQSGFFKAPIIFDFNKLDELFKSLM